MKTMLLAAVAVIGTTILSANWFVAASNAAPVLPKYTGHAILRVAGDDARECREEVRKNCATQCKGRNNEQDCFRQCTINVGDMCGG